ncbi:hypothetical protein BHUM_04412c [Candidatus Burkholderia humilis]|nr:hypothetical protein BHUM_04412c [Candidatus Burkholderia humilis]
MMRSTRQSRNPVNALIQPLTECEAKFRSNALVSNALVWRTVIVPGSMRWAICIATANRNGLAGLSPARTVDGIPDLDDQFLRNETLAELAKALGPRTSFDYDYDFGDGWEHRVTVQETLALDPAFTPEDVGGTVRLTPAS